MSLATITLSTNKSYRVINDDRRKLRQSEKGLILKVELLNQNGSSYDLTGKTLVFSENKVGNKIVVDDSYDAFTITDAKAGKFEYKLHSQVYSDSGVAWFEIKDGAEVIDTTRDFYFDVIKDAIYNPANDNYVSTLGALEDHYNGVIQKSEQGVNAIIEQFKSDVATAISSGKSDIANEIQDAQTKIDQLEKSGNDLIANLKQTFNVNNQKLIDLQAQWQMQTKQIQNIADSQIAKIKADAQAQTQQINENANSTISAINQKAEKQANAIQAKADQQLKDNKENNDAEIAKLEKQLADNQTANDAELKRVADDSANKLAEVEQAKNDAIAEIVKQRDLAIATANQSFTDKINSMQSDYDTWKSKQVADFTAQIKVLSDKLDSDESKESELDTRLKTLQASVDQAQKDFASVDFTKFALTANTYSKSEVDSLVASAGKVKTVDSKQPDSNGNISIDHYTKAETDQKIEQGGKVKTVNGNAPDSSGNVDVPTGVTSFNGQTGDVNLDLGVTSVNGQKGSITGIATLNDIKVQSVNGKIGNVSIDVGVTSVNGQTGAVTGIATTNDVNNSINSLKNNIRANSGFYIDADNGHGGRSSVLKTKVGNDINGMQIALGGGGTTIVSGGESATTILDGITTNDERLILANDAGIEFYTNVQNGIDSAHKETIDNNGVYSGTANNANNLGNLSADQYAKKSDITDIQNQVNKLSENMTPFLITDDPKKALEFSNQVNGGVGIVQTS